MASNQFAADTLIPDVSWAAFRSSGRFTSSAVKEFAYEVGIASSIVAGRLHREELVSRTQLLVTCDCWIVVTNVYDEPRCFIFSAAEIRQTAKLYDETYWAQGPQFDNQLTRDTWLRILLDFCTGTESDFPSET